MTDRRRDVLEAQRFARRRLVAAFTTGRAEVDPAAPSGVRALVVGLVLSALVVGGGEVAHRLDRPATRFAEDGVLVEVETGRQFVVWRGGGPADSVLVEVPDRTTARLLLGGAPGAVERVAAPDVRRGRTVPVPTAALPDFGAATGAAGGSGDTWSSCPGESPRPVRSRVRNSVQNLGKNALPESAALGMETPDGVRWLVRNGPRGAVRHRLAPEVAGLPEVLGVGVREVPAEWLAAVPRATPVRPLHEGELVATRAGFGVMRPGGPVAVSHFGAAVAEAGTGRAARLLEQGALGAVGAGEVVPPGWPVRVDPAPAWSRVAPCLQLQRDGTLLWTHPDHPPTPAAGAGMRADVGSDWLSARGAANVSGDRQEVVLWRSAAGQCVVLVGRDTSDAVGLDAAALPRGPRGWADQVPDCRAVSRRQLLASVEQAAGARK